MKFKPFYVGTCENKASNEQLIPFPPPSEKTPFEPFLIQDPFGLRKAVVPLFKRDVDGEIYGMGTAFHVDGWGTFLTADHVIEFARERSKSASTSNTLLQNSNGDHPILLLGVGLAFGAPYIPTEAFVLVEHIVSAMREKDNPLARLQGKIELENSVDLAAMTVTQIEAHEIPRPHFIPVRSSGWYPSPGEIVLAVGFRELEHQQLDESSQARLLAEGMYGAYGRIRAIHNHGRDKSNPTPVFEVECNWRSGMSGGPVFNSSGEVVGLVSRSLYPDKDLPGVGWATCFGLIPYFCDFVPTLDSLNFGSRYGWGVIRSEPRHLAGFFKTEEEARQLANSMNNNYQVKYGSNNFGTDDFMEVDRNDWN
jgi:serine protease Do